MKRKRGNFLFFFSLLVLLVFGLGGCGPADTTHITATGGDNVVTDTQPPTTPTGLTAVAISASQINLRWKSSSDDVAVVGYIIKKDEEVVAALSATGYLDSGLESATEYCYSVAAYDGASNQSEYTGPVCATTLPEVVVGEWELPFGYDGYSVISDASGNAYIGGGYDIDGNPFVGRINADGTVAWVVSTPGTGGVDRGNGIAISLDGSAIYLKYFFDISSQTSVGYREFVRKYDSKTGTLVWSHQLSIPCGTDGSIGSLAVDSTGAIFAAGVGCVTKLTDNGESVSEEFTSNLYSAADVSVPADGDYYYSTGATPVDNYFTVTIAKYRKSDGGVEWEHEWRRDGFSTTQFGGESICATPDGTVFVGTSAWYYENGFVHLPADIVRWDTDGNLLGSTAYGDLPIGGAKGMSCDSSIAYFGVYTNAVYAMDETGGIVWSNPTGKGSYPDGIYVNTSTGIIYEVIDNVVLRFDSQTGDIITP